MTTLFHIATVALIASLIRGWVLEHRRREALEDRFARLSAWTWQQAVQDARREEVK